MTNPFENRAPSLNGPATDLVPVTPSDSVDFADTAIALFIETGGTLSFVSVAGQSRTVTVGDGMIFPVGVSRVNATGTTATGIHAFTVA
ncbi:spike base protein, RCAP_Rcc01079 family [Aliiroseovarius sp. YM-037]|uniref:spike base protein, RCAP_Rcc01079 family n=1 Tax=Aliiroseovarius sp. YM-037 TaxID=3341728 RepID=UPI003A804285